MDYYTEVADAGFAILAGECILPLPKKVWDCVVNQVWRIMLTVRTIIIYFFGGRDVIFA